MLRMGAPTIDVLPALAGMSPQWVEVGDIQGRAPRASGDEPFGGPRKSKIQACSPR